MTALPPPTLGETESAPPLPSIEPERTGYFGVNGQVLALAAAACSALLILGGQVALIRPEGRRTLSDPPDLTMASGASVFVFAVVPAAALVCAVYASYVDSQRAGLIAIGMLIVPAGFGGGYIWSAWLVNSGSGPYERSEFELGAAFPVMFAAAALIIVVLGYVLADSIRHGSFGRVRVLGAVVAVLIAFDPVWQTVRKWDYYGATIEFGRTDLVALSVAYSIHLTVLAGIAATGTRAGLTVAAAAASCLVVRMPVLLLFDSDTGWSDLFPDWQTFGAAAVLVAAAVLAALGARRPGAT